MSADSAQTRAHIFFRYSALGDVVLCSGALSAVQNLAPNDTSYFITNSSMEKLIQNTFPSNTTCIGLENSREPLYWFKHGWSLAQTLAMNDAFLYDLHGNSKSKLFFLGFRLSWFHRSGQWLPLFCSPKFSLLRLVSVLVRKDLVTELFGKRWVYKDHLLTVRDSGSLGDFNIENHNPVLTAKKIQNKTILLAPDAQHWKKRWPANYWIQLSEKILTHYPEHKLRFVGSLSIYDHEPHLKKNIERLETDYPKRVSNSIGMTSLESLAQVAAESSLCFCSNSAWLHIAEAVGTKTISLAGPIVPGFGFSPWSHGSQEMSVPLNCRPCTRHGSGPCVRPHTEFHACMTQLSPQNVFAKFQTLTN